MSSTWDELVESEERWAPLYKHQAAFGYGSCDDWTPFSRWLPPQPKYYGPAPKKNPRQWWNDKFLDLQRSMEKAIINIDRADRLAEIDFHQGIINDPDERRRGIIHWQWRLLDGYKIEMKYHMRIRDACYAQRRDRRMDGSRWRVDENYDLPFWKK